MKHILLVLFVFFTVFSPARESIRIFRALYDDPQTSSEAVLNEIFRFNAFLSEEARHNKFTQMAADSFSFYRATGHLYFSDWKTSQFGLEEKWLGPRSWIQGDFHFQNLGFFDENQEIIFWMNDFDETVQAPCVLDLHRFLASLYLAFKDHRKMAAEAFLDGYVQGLEAENLVIEKRISEKMNKLLKKRSMKKLLEKWTVHGSSGLLFNTDLENLKKPSDSLSLQIRKGLEKLGFKVFDLALRLNSGLGSLGVKKIYALVKKNEGGFFLLEIKEERISSFAFAFGEESLPVSQADRVLLGEKIMSKGFSPSSLSMKFQDSSFLIRNISPYKDGFEVLDLQDQELLSDFSRTAGRILGLAHANSLSQQSKADLLSLLHSSSSDLLHSVKNYADKVRMDYEAFASFYALQ